MPIARVNGARRQHQRQVGQGRVEALRQVLALVLEALDALQLVQAQGCGDVGQVVLEARRHDLVVPAGHLGREAVEGIAVDAVQAHDLGARGQLGAARDQHAALARGHGLVGVEAEDDGVAVVQTDELAAPGGGQRVGRVFDHLHAMLVRDGLHRVHVHRQARVVHRHDGFGLGRDGRFKLGQVDVQRGRVDVHQLDVSAQVAHHLGRGREGVRGGDDLVTRADAQRFERQVQARRGRVDGDAVQAGLTEEGAKRLFELARLGAGGDPARAQRVDDLGDFFFADFRQGKGQEGGLVVSAHGRKSQRVRRPKAGSGLPRTRASNQPRSEPRP